MKRPTAIHPRHYNAADSECAHAALCAYYVRPIADPTGKALASWLRHKVVYAGRPVELLAELQKMAPNTLPKMSPRRFTKWLGQCGGRIGSFRVVIGKKSGRILVAIWAGGDPMTERCAEGGAE